MTVELRHLRCFLAIAEEGNVTRAAVRLHLTQPALSRTLRQLEEHLRVRLVDRSTHHLALTPAGKVFRDRATGVVAAVDDLLDPHPCPERPLRVGHAWSAFGEHTTAVLRQWGRSHPHVPLELLRIDDRTAGLERGQVDVAVLRHRVHLAGIDAQPLTTEARVAAVASDSPLAGRPALTLADLATQPVSVNTVSGSTTLDLWPVDAAPSTTVEVANTDDWLVAIAAGRAVGITTIATTALHPHPGIRYIPLTDAAPVTVHLAWRRPPTHPRVPDLLAFIREIISPVDDHSS